ncbi:haloacid dehalogenase superfamily, subfamily IA, variant 3 with third motif having DD or ED/haloacid dehalogenase superfamily, subfamily IA, variant 1 with third motif having Dx(3-4)D or Dx(3-4)E [Tistlia consotensis]|uniref:Haloacid dehalogenase superfamily, subfamily IA, variant 3 with third motif having DD or ED/haloacid dehalogenase superfamily, subfamily IA, variant 1 with third motif having Dx(3-4)D or Dx(3-4)E n=1 Tax=Tistlia consotensis USBA 355 TaxID=560819 RepID=A0A1Y6CCT5_9PROT|nr:HAD family hydrolase [Tistlia consotensis]SMF48590.1 haloacid dehalogenase superfamily, subfamily IA, variant 3 with third motif having DD or ED/haloacid dehalogenase superfamily, subfamily IA, variant 1 with third motif having Dx(3-4)D or Dx(3-4)E [Tistlia consotensis USBA 355]SNR80997.1 haloacid dehalogenase superfamily, subfamily IA, variant 3 with third motif having DD or ED/haloacid dehalogenase superfamily, subfamily IA, variant 1 with third motif having Dx(3-4)D or Dx(3-4)E [Tistlia con
MAQGSSRQGGVPARPARAVLFDWGGTLVDYPASNARPDDHALCVRSAYDCLVGDGLLDAATPWERFQPVYMAETLSLIRRAAETHEEHSFLERFGNTFARLGLAHPGDDRFGPVVEVLSDALIAHCRPMPGAEALLNALAGRLPVAVVSNFPHRPVVEGTLAEAGFERHLDALVVSADLGLAKPHPEIYRTAAAKLGVAPEDCLFVGDEPLADVVGPARLGCTTALLPGRHGMAVIEEPSFRIASLDELLGLPVLAHLRSG